MRKVSTIIMALAVILGMTQCEKPAMQLYDGSYTGVTKEITFSTGGSSKVTVDNSVLNELKFKWQGTDNLYVYGSANGTFSDGKYCGSLALVKGEGTENGFFSGTLDNVPTSGTLRFYYCAAGLFDEEQETITVDLSTQDGSLNDPDGIASHLVAYADVTVKPDGGDYSATLAVPYSVVKLDLHEFGTTDITMTGTTNSGLTISANGVKGVTGGTSTTLSGVTSESNAYYVAVMPESVTTLNFSGNGLVGSKTVTLSENKFETLSGGGSVPVPAAEPLYLSGDFTVGYGADGIIGTADDVKVKFSKGNMYWDGSAFHMEENQWDYDVVEKEKPEDPGPDEPVIPWEPGLLWNPNHVSHFYWDKTASVTYAQDYSGVCSWSDELFTNAQDYRSNPNPNPDFTVEGETGTWRVLSQGDWWVLICDRTPTTTSANFKTLTISGTSDWVRGLVLLPDNSTASLDDITTTDDLTTVDAVFLPAAGLREGASVICEDFGLYIASNFENYDKVFFLNCLTFYMDGVMPWDFQDLDRAVSVRLVRNVTSK